MHHALGHRPQDPIHLVGQRRAILDIFARLAPSVQVDSDTLVDLAHPDLRKVLVKQNLALMRGVSFVVRDQGHDAILDLLWGWSVPGLARHCPSLV